MLGNKLTTFIEMIFIGAESCDYQSFVQIYVRQLAKVASRRKSGQSGHFARFMDSHYFFAARILLSRQIVTHGNRRRLITIIALTAFCFALH